MLNLLLGSANILADEFITFVENVADMRSVEKTLRSIRSKADVDLAPLEQFLASLEAQINGTADGAIRRAMKQWAARYRSFAQQRFDANSKGGGDWPPLAASTIRKRRHGKGKGKAFAKAVRSVHGGPSVISGSPSILRDTGLLFAALGGGPGSLEEHVPGGVRVGFGGSARHGSSPATIADIAEIHDTGGGHVPQREILVEPDDQTIALMVDDLERAIAAELAQTDQLTE